MHTATIPGNIKSAVSALLLPYGMSFEALTKPLPTADNRRRYLPLREAVEYSGIGRWTLWRAVQAGKIRQAKLSDAKSGKVLIDRDSLDAWLDSRIVRPRNVAPAVQVQQ